MDTADVSYRIVDFLKTNPPFGAMADTDLLALTQEGRVKFYEANDFILWQGEPHKVHVFVIQQGTVSLWDDAGERSTLRDIRGAGDLLGIERFNGARACLQSARAESDVLIYAFAEADFEALLAKYPLAREYVAAYGSVTVYQSVDHRRDAGDVFLHDVVGGRSVVSCAVTDRIADVARRLLDAGSPAIVVLDADHQALDVLTTDRLIEWIADGGGDARQTVAGLLRGRPVTIGADASVTDGVLAMVAANVDALALTAGGASGAHVHGVVTSRDLAPIFGDQPSWILDDIAVAADHRQLRDLNVRARAFVLRSLTGAASVDWLARFTHLVDVAIVGRLIGFTGSPRLNGCWCFCDAAGREESLTALAPDLVVIADAEHDRDDLAGAYAQVMDALGDCGYLVKEPVFDLASSVASLAEWQRRYRGWIGDPVRQQTYRARSLFDVRAVHGPSRSGKGQGRHRRRRWTRFRPRPGERLSRQPATADVLPGRGRRRVRGAALDVSTRAQRAQATGRRRPRVCARGAGPPGRSTLERLAIARGPCYRSRRRFSATQPRRCGSCSGSRAGSGSARAPTEWSCPQRSSAATTVRP